MLDIFYEVLSRAENFVTVLSSELSPLPIGVIGVGSLWFFLLYYISRWFKAYIIRVVLFSLGVSLFYTVMARNNIITAIDFYISLGLIIPHLEIVEITYLLIREKTLFLVDKIIELFYLIISPFVWVYNLFFNMFQFLEMKQEQRKQKKAEKDYYKEEFKREQERAYHEEQQKYYNQDKQRQDFNQEQKQKKQYKYKKKEKKQEEPQQPKEEKPKTYLRWDSSNPYEVLGIDESSTAKEIKKAYRNLSKIYHPDLTLTKKEEHTIIFQKINGAYDILK